MKEKVGCIKKNGKYLIVREDGSSKLITSKEGLNKYLTDNNCEIED